MNDFDSASLAFTQLEKECPLVWDEGRAHRPKASIFAMATEVIARSNVGGSMRSLFRDQPASPQRPKLDLTDPASCDVLRADYTEKGMYFELRGRQDKMDLPFSNLPVNTAISWSGSDSGVANSDSTGALTITMPLDGNSQLHVEFRP